MDKQEPTTKTEKKVEPQAMKEVSDDSLEKVDGGVQPKPTMRCTYCRPDTCRMPSCPLNPKNVVDHL